MHAASSYRTCAALAHPCGDGRWLAVISYRGTIRSASSGSRRSLAHFMCHLPCRRRYPSPIYLPPPRRPVRPVRREPARCSAVAGGGRAHIQAAHRSAADQRTPTQPPQKRGDTRHNSRISALCFGRRQPWAGTMAPGRRHGARGGTRGCSHAPARLEWKSGSHD